MERYHYYPGEGLMENETGDWVRHDESAAAIAALEAEVARKDAAIRRALAKAVADDMDGWYAGLRAALADQPAEGGK